MATTAIGFGGIQGNSSNDEVYEDKLPEGDKYFGFVNVVIQSQSYLQYRKITFVMQILRYKFCTIARHLESWSYHFGL
jgi:hypothetical protein